MDKRQQTCCFTGHRILPRDMEDELWTKNVRSSAASSHTGSAIFWRRRSLGF